MSQAPQFVISEFTNPSGEIVVRLTGWLDGKRIRSAVHRKPSSTTGKTDTFIRFAGRSLIAAVLR